MSNIERISLDDIQVDKNNLYREESFTDLRVASIRRLVPIKSDGSPDDTRDAIYTCQTTVMSAAGMLPVSGPIDATSMEEAVEKFPEAIRAAMEQMIEEAKEYQRQEASRIVVPRGGQPPGGIQIP